MSIKRILIVLSIIVCIGILAIALVLIYVRGNGTQPITRSPLSKMLRSARLKTHSPYSQTVAKDTEFVPFYPIRGPFTGLTDMPEWVNSEPLSQNDLLGRITVLFHMIYYQKLSHLSFNELNAMHTQFSTRDVRVIGISNTNPYSDGYEGKINPNTLDGLRPMLIKHGVLFPVALDSKNSMLPAKGSRGSEAWPQHIVVDRSGNIRYILGGNPDYSKLHKAVQYLVNDDREPVSFSEITDTYTDDVLKVAQEYNSRIASVESGNIISIQDTYYLIEFDTFKDSQGRQLFPPDFSGSNERRYSSPFFSLIVARTSKEETIVGVPFDPAYCALLQRLPLESFEKGPYEVAFTICSSR